MKENRSSKLKAQSSRSQIRRFLEGSKRLEDGETIKEEGKKARKLEGRMKGYAVGGEPSQLEADKLKAEGSRLKAKPLTI